MVFKVITLYKLYISGICVITLSLVLRYRPAALVIENVYGTCWHRNTCILLPFPSCPLNNANSLSRFVAFPFALSHFEEVIYDSLRLNMKYNSI